MSYSCNNINNCHDPITIGEDLSALRVICKQCGHQDTIHKDPNTGAPEKREYARVFKRDILQGKDPLFYKIYPQYLKT